MWGLTIILVKSVFNENLEKGIASSLANRDYHSSKRM